MLLFTRSSNANRALCALTLGLALLLAVAVSAQNQRDQFIIRVAEQPADLDNGSVGAARAGGGFDLPLAELFLNAAGATGTSGAAETELQAPDVVVEGLNLSQRNNLIAAAGNAQAPAPQQRSRLYLNSGLRRR